MNERCAHYWRIHAAVTLTTDPSMAQSLLPSLLYEPGPKNWKGMTTEPLVWHHRTQCSDITMYLQSVICGAGTQTQRQTYPGIAVSVGSTSSVLSRC
uniref:Uncharacterized protein n=1 Tax=Setaria digitata TaxID=48799 RepID=A0A915PXH4_9BILA